MKRIQGALDVCSVMDGVDFDIHSGYAPNSDSTSCDRGKDKRKTLLGPADNQDQAAKEQRREDPAAGQSKFFIQFLIKETLVQIQKTQQLHQYLFIQVVIKEQWM